jgi:hypothetical protein
MGPLIQIAKCQLGWQPLCESVTLSSEASGRGMCCGLRAAEAPAMLGGAEEKFAFARAVSRL